MKRKADQPEVRHAVFEGRYTYDEIRVGSKTGESLVAFDEDTLQFVVVKRPSLSQPNPDLRRASMADLEREERALRTAGIREHPAACRLLDARDAESREGRYRYLVLERARGLAVPALIRDYHDRGQPLPEWTYLNMLRQLLSLLAAAHRAGVVYNDVKADHLFWDDKTHRLTVIDWSNAQFLAETDSVTPADDVYQCGELLWEFITGDKWGGLPARHPPLSPSPREEAERGAAPGWEAPLRLSVAPGLKRLLSRALHPDRAHRYAAASDMARDLDDYFEDRSRRISDLLTSARDAIAAADAGRLAEAATQVAEALAFNPSDETANNLWRAIEDRRSGRRPPAPAAERRAGARPHARARQRALAYPDRLPPEAGPSEFDAWLNQALAELDEVSRLAPDDPELTAHRQNLGQLESDWNSLLDAARKPDAPQTRLAVAQLERRALSLGLPAPVLAAVTRLRQAAEETPWHFLDDPDFVTRCDLLVNALERGAISESAIGSLLAATARRVQTAAEAQWFEYFKELCQAQAAVAAGNLNVAIHNLQLAKDRPVSGDHWNMIYDCCQLARAIGGGDEAAARQAHDDLLKHHGPGALQKPLVRLCADNLESLPLLKSALALFVEQPAQAGPRLEALPVLLRSGTAVLKVAACSRAVQGGLDRWQAGDFAGASAALATALAQAASLPDFLGMPLRAASVPITNYRDGAQACERDWREILAHVAETRRRRTPADAPTVRERLSQIAHRLPPRDGEPGRPQVWLEAFDEAVRLVGEGDGGAKIEALLARRKIGESDPARPVIAALVPPVLPVTLPAVQPAPSRRRRSRRSLPGLARRWIVAAVAVLAVMIGLVLAGPFGERRPATATRAPEVAAASPAPPPTLQPTPVAPTEVAAPTPTMVQVACDQIASAQQAGQWQAVIDQVVTLSGNVDVASLACDGRAVRELESQAHYQLGLESYQAGDYAAALQSWAAAKQLNAGAAPLDLLIGCATARAGGDPALVASLAGEFGVEQIAANCGFDPRAYLPTPTAAPLAIDLLAAMAGRSVSSLHTDCHASPCPGLYRAGGQEWRFTAFNQESFVPLDDYRQFQSTGQEWGDRLRGFGIQFSVVNVEPYSFPYGAQVGLEAHSADGRTRAMLLAFSRPTLQVGVDVVEPGDGVTLCEANTIGPLVTVAADGTALSHTLSLAWESGGRLQFLVDGQAICQSPIPMPTAPRVSLYLSGWGASLAVGQLSATLAPP